MIAIENVRLFKELEARTQDLTRSVGELRALGDVGRALSSTLDLDTVLQTIVTRASQLAGTDACSVFEYDEVAEVFRLRASSYRDPGEAETLDAIGRATPIPKGQGVASRAAASRQPVQVSDIAVEGSYESPIRGPLMRAGYRAILTVPLFLEERVIGALGVSRKTPGEFAPEIVRLLTTFATQSALAIQNARLFREIADKSRQLEAASRHKSEFLANMSHELRTPLNAILGFSEVLAERMFGEVNEKQAEYLQDILSSGRHLLSLINDILDLSKVEAGRLELELGRFHLPTALDNALILVRERATRHGITLTHSVDPGVADIVADERKVKQILLNLLSNAVKFTPEGGRVGLTATVADGVVTIAVSDTGIGIAPEDQAAIFEEFRQVGREDARKQEGTGLGLTLAKKFVELHGGGSGSRARWARGRRSASRCRFGLTAGVRATRAEARRHGHDVSPVPGRQPRRRTILPRVRRTRFSLWRVAVTPRDYGRPALRHRLKPGDQSDPGAHAGGARPGHPPGHGAQDPAACPRAAGPRSQADRRGRVPPQYGAWPPAGSGGVYRRYAIVAEADLSEGVKKLATLRARTAKRVKLTERGTVAVLPIATGKERAKFAAVSG